MTKKEEKKMVFVLGAGASISLNKKDGENLMPSGLELVKQIAAYREKATMAILMRERLSNSNNNYVESFKEIILAITR